MLFFIGSLVYLDSTDLLKFKGFNFLFFRDFNP